MRFEDLKANVIAEVKRMLDFLKVPYSESELEERMKTRFEKYHRKNIQHFDHFTAVQKQYMFVTLNKTINLLREENNGNTLGLAEYLLTLNHSDPTT